MFPTVCYMALHCVPINKESFFFPIFQDSSPNIITKCNYKMIELIEDEQL